MAFGKVIQRQRQKRGLSRAELAAAVGLSRQYIRDLEIGQTKRPSWQVVSSICRALELDPASFELIGQK